VLLAGLELLLAIVNKELFLFDSIFGDVRCLKLGHHLQEELDLLISGYDLSVLPP
jgi:hypothetical protein